MPKWEYFTLESWRDTAHFQWSSTVPNTLNDLGDQGWELVTVIDKDPKRVEWVFKRPRMRYADAAVGSYAGPERRGNSLS